MSSDPLAIALDEFQRILTPDQTARLKSYSNHAPTPDDVVSLTDQVIQSNASRKSRIFASRLHGLLGSVQQYCNIVDTCVGPNQIASLVWGSIKLVILTSSNFVEYFDKLSERVAQLSNYCPRFLEYQKLFSTSTRLQQALSDFHAVVVSFCSKALHVIQERGVKRFSKSVWKSFKIEFKEVEERISEAKNEVAEELALASEQEAHKFRGYLTVEVEKNNSFRVEQRSEIEASRDFRSQQTHALQRTEARQIQKILREQERQKIRLLRLIPSHDYTLSLRRVRGLRCEGTCDWLLQRPEIREWIELSNAKHIWCYGIPGCGKSVLLGHVIDHLKRSFAGRSSTVVIHYFFDSSEKKSLQASAFLRCILHQAITVDNLLPDSQRRLESLFEDQIGESEPATDDLAQLFCHFLRKFKFAFLLIDGLDEVSRTEQRNVKALLTTIRTIDSARIFAMTHADMDMTKVLTCCSCLQIKADDLEHDIAAFIQSQIDTYSQNDLIGCSSSALDLIKQKLVSDAEGMFLWANLQFKAIIDACEEDGTPDRIPDLLEALPQGIADFYSLLLRRVTEAPDQQAERAKRAFQWAIYGRRPLTIEELEEAVSITMGQKSWNVPAFKLDISRLGRLCANLIDHDEATKRVILAHHSVELFLRNESDREDLRAFAINEVKIEQYLAEVCLTYLSFTDFHKALVRTPDTRQLHALDQPTRLIQDMTPGMIRPWIFKAVSRRRPKETGRSIDIVNVLRTELSSHQPKRANPNFRMLEYCKTYWHTHSRHIDPQQDMQRFSHLQNFVHGTNLPKEWMPWSAIENKQSLPYWELFVWAVENGHRALFYVWKNVAMTEEPSYWECFWREQDPKMFTSVCAKANLDQLEILLLPRRVDNGFSRPSKDEFNQALVKACHLGHIDVVERLLQEKADVNAAAAGYSGRTALQAAAEGGHLAVVERLLQEKADVNAAAAAGRGGRTALQAAAAGGYKTTVECLRQAGATL